MNYSRYAFLAILAGGMLGLFGSCRALDDQAGMGGPGGESVTVKVTFSPGEGSPWVRGAATEPEMQVHSATVLCYDRSGRKVGYAATENGESVSFVLSAGRIYSFRALLNFGAVAENEAMSSLETLQGLRVRFNETASFEGGLPAVAAFDSYAVPPGRTEDAEVVLEASWLVSRWSFSCSDPEALYSLESVSVKQAAGDCTPFSATSSKSTMASSGRTLSPQEVAALESGGTTVFYLPVNMRGKLLSGAGGLSDKILGDLPPSEAALVTYVEVRARSGDGVSLMYRICPGTSQDGSGNDPDSFDIPAGRDCSLMLSMNPQDRYDSRLTAPAKGTPVRVSWVPGNLCGAQDEPCQAQGAGSGLTTRSSYGGSDSGDASDIAGAYLAAYMEDGGMLMGEAYDPAGNSVEMTLLSGYRYRFLTLVNCGKPQMPDNLKDALSMRIQLPGPVSSDPFPGGLPMAGSESRMIDFGGDLGAISVTRMVSRWNVSFSNPDRLHYSIKSVRMRNGAGNFTPWTEGSAATAAYDGDRATPEDLARLNSHMDGSVSIPLYVVENMRGSYPACSTPASRSAETIAAQADTSLFTYCEVVLEFDGAAGEYVPVSGTGPGRDVVYRHYLGSGSYSLTSDFNVPRGRVFSLSFTGTMAGIENALSGGSSWRLEANVRRR